MKAKPSIVILYNNHKNNIILCVCYDGFFLHRNKYILDNLVTFSYKKLTLKMVWCFKYYWDIQKNCLSNKIKLFYQDGDVKNYFKYAFSIENVKHVYLSQRFFGIVGS